MSKRSYAAMMGGAAGAGARRKKAVQTQKAQRAAMVLSRRFSGPGGELKFFDTAISFTFDTTGEVPANTQLVLIPQGVTDSTRIGRKCTIKSIQTRLTIANAPASSATGSCVLFLYLVQDTQANGAAAAITDVLTSNAMAAAMINLTNSQRFRILKKWKWEMNSAAGVTTAYNNVSKHLDWYTKCNIPLEYSAGTGAITEIRSNNLFFLAGSDGGGDDTGVCIGTVRVRFSDG